MACRLFGSISALVASCALIFACSPSGTEGSDSAQQELGGVAVDPGHVPPTVFQCDKTGVACCVADSAVPTAHCIGGAVGCNIATNKCEPCGGPGQVCCDGPHTAFNGKNLSYEPSPWNPELSPVMCRQPASCDARQVNGHWEGSRTCKACGTARGAACCAPDAEFAVTRCVDADPGIVRGRLTCSDMFSATNATCVPCGVTGAPLCTGRPCIDGFAVQGGQCQPCGDIGMPTCDDGEPCRTSQAVPVHGTCVKAGGPNEPCKQDGTCINYGLSCQEGVCKGACGNLGGACCGILEVGFECYDGASCRSDKCEPCGGSGQICCGDANCNAGLTCDQNPFNPVLDGHCQPAAPPPPPPPPPPGPLPSCDGTPWTTHQTFHIFLQVFPNRCLVDGYYAANSIAAAQQCGLNAYPGTVVVNDIVDTYDYYSYDDQGVFCTNHSVGATNGNDAQTCAEATWGVGVQTGTCP